MEDENETPIYFTKEIDEKVRGMSDADMFQLLYELEQSEYWIAMLRYNQIRSSYTQSAILAADPVKDPTLIARNQGIMMGLADMQNAVIIMWQDRQKAKREAEAESSTEVE